MRFESLIDHIWGVYALWVAVAVFFFFCTDLTCWLLIFHSETFLRLDQCVRWHSVINPGLIRLIVCVRVNALLLPPLHNKTNPLQPCWTWQLDLEPAWLVVNVGFLHPLCVRACVCACVRACVCVHKVAPPQRHRRPEAKRQKDVAENLRSPIHFHSRPRAQQLLRQIVPNETEINGAVRSTGYFSAPHPPGPRRPDKL